MRSVVDRNFVMSAYLYSYGFDQLEDYLLTLVFINTLNDRKATES